MRRTIVKRLATLVVIAAMAALSPAVSFAQGRRGGIGRGAGVGGAGLGRGGAVAGPMDDETTLLLFTALLDLSDAQRQALQVVFDNAVKTAAPLAAQIEANRDGLFEAAKSGKSDDQIKSLAAPQSSLETQIMVLQAQTFLKMWTILTDVQKPQVDRSMYDDIGVFLSNARPTAPTPTPTPAPAPAPLPAPTPTSPGR